MTPTRRGAIKRALRRDPNFLSAQLGLARVRQRQGQYAEALQSAEAAEKLAPESAQVAVAGRGQILEKLGRPHSGAGSVYAVSEAAGAGARPAGATNGRAG